MGVLVIIWLLASNLVFAFQCTPVRRFWYGDDVPGHCINVLTAVQISQGCNAALDAVILALPVSGVLRLKMSKSRKISVMAIFLLGGL